MPTRTDHENQKFDEDSSVRITETPFARRIYSSGGYTYVCVAAPGTATSMEAWRISRTDGDGNTLWADGNAKFDNVADDYATITFS